MRHADSTKRTRRQLIIVSPVKRQEPATSSASYVGYALIAAAAISLVWLLFQLG